MDYKNADVCSRIKDIMREMSLGQKDLSIRTGVVQSSVSAILNGKRNPTPLVEAMHKKMGISKEWLVNGAGLKYESSKDLMSKGRDMASRRNLSAKDRVDLIKEMNALYSKHESLLQEAQNIMKIIVGINKKILINDY